MKKRMLAVLTALALALSLLPSVGIAAETGENIISVADQGDVRQAVADAPAGAIIEISGTGFVNDVLGSGAGGPWIIDKTITIRGKEQNSSLNLRAGGIVLGANVTFENIHLDFTNRVRNAIMANGYKLTLDGISRSPGTRNIHLFCGGMNSNNYSVPDSGDHGQLVIRNCKNLGNIYAGSLSSDGTDNSFPHPATVTIESGELNSVGSLYGCGALETPVTDNWFDGEEPAPPSPSSDRFKMTGTVEFHLYDTVTSSVDGKTGSTQNAAVYYTGGTYPNSSLTLENISQLSLVSGVLHPALGSSFSPDTKLEVPVNTTLGLESVTEPTVGEFVGGGTLVLGNPQSLTIDGAVSGTTMVEVTKKASDLLPSGTVLIRAPQSTETAFCLAALSTQPNMTLQWGDGGIWTTYDPTVISPALVKSLSVANLTVPTGQQEISIPIEVTFNSPEDFLYDVPLSVIVNSKSAVCNAGGQYYTWSEVGTPFSLFVYEDSFSLMTDIDVPVPEGTYNFGITVPKANSASGTALPVNFTLTVSDDVPQLKPIAIPTAITGLQYTGEVQTGVAEGEGYTLAGHQAADVGTHTATAKLEPGYQWSDGSTSNQTISWIIGKADGPAAPTGLAAVAPTAATLLDGKITGTTGEMEYDSDIAFSNATDCTDSETTGLPSGIYYIRFKETSTHSAGQSIAVTVPAYGAPTMYTVTVTGSHAAVSGAGSYPAGTLVHIYAGTFSGHVFDGWTASGTTLDSTDSPDTSFTMPEHDVSIQAAWRVHNGSDSGSGDDSSSGGDNLPGGGPSDDSGLPPFIPIRPGDSSGSPGSKPEPPSTPTPPPTQPAPSDLEVTVQNGAALATVSSGVGQILVDQAAANGSSSIVIAPRIETDVNEVAVTFPSSLASDAASRTHAALKVETPLANVSIPNHALGALAARTETISISVHRTGNALDLTIKAGTQPLTELPGGITLTVPYASCTPGTVAVLVLADGTREVIRKSIAVAGIVTIPLPGSAKAEIVDNRKAYTDVPADNWAADAVAFASAHQLLEGTGKDTFEPNAPMTRGMLAMVLYNLENNPDHPLTGKFADVNSGAWYAQAVSWAAERELLSGYGNSIFGAEDCITREQLALVLWRYSGEAPASSTQLPFQDGDSASSWALEALYWAVEEKIIQGKNNGILDPRGQATRAEVAQMLYEFLRH